MEQPEVQPEMQPEEQEILHHRDLDHLQIMGIIITIHG
jgi:hypothetical protein